MNEETFEGFIHGKLLEQLKFIDEVCRKENIEYSLVGGTLLGAVRHNGFIPWDDDADVVMTRSEFNRFKEVVKHYMDGTTFEWNHRSRVEGIVQSESFRGGIYKIITDIFVLDYVPDGDRAFKKHIFRLKKLQGMMKKGKIDWKKYSLKGKILVFATKMLGSFHSMEKLLDRYVEESTRYDGAETKRMIISNDLYETFDIPYEKELLCETEDHVFETETFRIFSHYDEILTALYGDYMTPPPESERHFQHVEKV